MMVRKKYVLGDYAKYSTGRLAAPFASISNMESYEFAEKLYVDDKHRAHRCHMLLVGHYSRKSGGPPVWARATGERVCYYSGAGTQVNPLVQDIHSSKVYYGPPFSIIGGSQDYSNARPGMNPERKLERAVVESAINLIFLASGRLEKVFDVVNPDLLGHFKLACANLNRHRKPLHTTGDALILGASVIPRRGDSTLSLEPHGQLHSKDLVPIDSRKRRFVDSRDLTNDSSQGNYNTDISFGLC
jgi:hypothetical protein